LILSTADIQWVLHNTAESATLDVEVERDGKTTPLKLTLEKGWRKRDNISWRATSWELRRMVTGGLVLDDLSDSDRRSAGLSESALALRIKHVGQYGEHAAGKKAGFNKDDILVAVDGRSNRMTEGDLMAYLLNAKRAGDRVPMTVQRGRERIELNLPMQ
jgi:S1-C subfamily serine protease